MKHEIEIEGNIPDGWEVDRVGRGRTGDSYLGPIHPDGFFQIHQVDHHSGSGTRVIVRRKVRKYDWSKTLDDVLVAFQDAPGYEKYQNWPSHTYELRLPDDIWQPNIHGKCPVDGEASIVRVILANGAQLEKLAGNFDWSCDNDIPDGDIKAWQLVRLADGVEW